MSLFFIFHEDIDECNDSELNECDSSALCTNTEGSFVCRCLVGYEGDGRKCIGRDQFLSDVVKLPHVFLLVQNSLTLLGLI